MADEELPLAEVRAIITAQRDIKQYTLQIVLPIKEDQQQMDAALRGGHKDKVLRMSLHLCPPDWKVGRVDPTQGEEEEDHIATLVGRWDTLAELMTTDVSP